MGYAHFFPRAPVHGLVIDPSALPGKKPEAPTHQQGGDKKAGRKPDPDAEAGKLRAACRRHVGSGNRIKSAKNRSRLSRYLP